MGGKLSSVAVAETDVYFQWAVARVPASSVGTLQVTLLGNPRRQQCWVLPPPPAPRDTLSVPIFSVLAATGVACPKECLWLILEICVPVLWSESQVPSSSFPILSPALSFLSLPSVTSPVPVLGEPRPSPLYPLPFQRT